jgi:hypothetical protein
MDPCCDVKEHLDQVPLLSRIASHRVPTIFKRFHVVAAGPRDMGRDTRSAHSISPADARPPPIQTTADNPGGPSTTSRNAVGRSELFSSESPRQLSIAAFSCAEVRLLRINTCRGPSAVCVFLRSQVRCGIKLLLPIASDHLAEYRPIWKRNGVERLLRPEFAHANGASAPVAKGRKTRARAAAGWVPISFPIRNATQLQQVGGSRGG